MIENEEYDLCMEELRDKMEMGEDCTEIIQKIITVQSSDN